MKKEQEKGKKKAKKKEQEKRTKKERLKRTLKKKRFGETKEGFAFGTLIMI